MALHFDCNCELSYSRPSEEETHRTAFRVCASHGAFKNFDKNFQFAHKHSHESLKSWCAKQTHTEKTMYAYFSHKKCHRMRPIRVYNSCVCLCPMHIDVTLLIACINFLNTLEQFAIMAFSFAQFAMCLGFVGFPTYTYTHTPRENATDCGIFAICVERAIHEEKNTQHGKYKTVKPYICNANK